MSIDCPIYVKGNRVFDKEMSTVEKILHSKKLNYEELFNIMKPYINNSKEETINIYIDLYDIVKQLYSPKFIEDFRNMRSKQKLMIIAEIINIVAHYRHFFFSRFGLYTSFIFYFSTEQDKYLTSIYSKFRNEFYNKRLYKSQNSEFFTMNKVMKDCFNIIRNFCIEIPHVYFIDSKEIDYHLVPYMFMNNMIECEGRVNGKDLNIIFSNEEIHLLDLVHNDNCLLFRNKGRGKSYIVDQYNIFLDLQKSYKDLVEVDLPQESLYFILALSGYKSYSIDNIKNHGIRKSMKLVYDMLCEGKNVISYNDENKIEEAFNKFKKEDIEKLKRNLKLINPETYPYKKEDLIEIEKQMIDIIDIEDLKKALFKHFDHNVILMEYLFDGEQL